MTRPTARCVWLLGLVLTTACGSNTWLPPTAPPPIVSAVSPVTPVGYRQISVGETVTGALESNGASDFFELTAPSTGALTGTASWDEKDGIIQLGLGAEQFASGSPLTGRIPVIAGQKYLIRIADSAPWDYHGLHLAYTFKSAVN